MSPASQLDVNRGRAVPEWGLAEAARAIRDSRITVADYVAACLERSDERAKALQAFVRLDDDYLRRRAYVFDRMPTDKRGPLHGVPVATGETDTGGGDNGAPLVAQAVGAGAILAGTTATPEFGCFGPGPTRNPFNADRSAGGSGAAAAVAAGMIPLAYDVRPDGEIGRAASFCGVYGLRLPRKPVPTGASPLLTTMFEAAGLYVRAAEDIGFVCRILLGARNVPADPAALAQRTEGLSVGLLQTASDYRIRAPVRSAINRAATVLSDARIDVSRQWLPARFVESEACYETIFSYEASRRLARYRDRDPGRMHPAVRERIDRGRRIDASAYEQARRDAIAMRSELLEMTDGDSVLLSAAVEDVAPPHKGDTGWSPMAALWALSGVPTLVIPCGRNDRLPVGIRLAAGPGREDLLARVACILEPGLKEN